MGTLWGARNVLYLNLGGGFMNVCVCKSSLSQLLQICTLTHVSIAIPITPVF